MKKREILEKKIKSIIRVKKANRKYETGIDEKGNKVQYKKEYLPVPTKEELNDPFYMQRLRTIFAAIANDPTKKDLLNQLNIDEKTK